MKVSLKFEANEIEKVDSMSAYNRLAWRLKGITVFGITHFMEIYNDVSEHPFYEFGRMDGDRFVVIATGEGDPVPADKIGFGGVWAEVDVFTPDLLGVDR